MAIGSPTSLTVENAGNDSIGIMICQTTYQCNGVFVGAHSRSTARQVKIKFNKSVAAPTQRQMRAILIFVDGDDDFIEHRAEQFLLVAGRGGWRLPNCEQIGAECKQLGTLLRTERSRSQRLPLRELGLDLVKCAQAVLPLGLEPTRNKTVIRVDSMVTTLGALRLITCALDGQTPLRKRAVVIGFEPLRRCKSRLNTKRLERGEHGARDRLVDLRRADAEAIDAATVCDGLAGAVIARRGGATGVVGAQLAAALSAHREALQQSGSFSHGATT